MKKRFPRHIKNKNKLERDLQMEKELQEIIVGLDLGASAIKIAIEVGDKIKKIIFDNRVNAGTITDCGGYIVEFGGETKQVGTLNGTPNMAKTKLQYNHLEDILLAVAYEVREVAGLHSEFKMNLKTVLPPIQFKSNAKAFRDRIKNLGKGGELRGTVNGCDLKIQIGSVSVACEGVTILNAINLDALSNVSQVLLLDFGGSTLDLATLIKHGAGWQIQGVDTIAEVNGTKMCEAIAAKVGNENNTTYDADLLSQTGNLVVKGENVEVAHFAQYADEVIKDLFILLGRRLDVNQYKVVNTGRAAEIVAENPIFKDKIPNAILLDETTRTFGNAVGALKG